MPDFGNLSPLIIAILRRRGLSNEQIRQVAENLQGFSSSQGAGGAGAGAADAGTPTEPPYMSFDPALEAEQRALERGLEDLLHDTHLERRYATRDEAQTEKDLQTQKRRGLRDIRQQRHRGLADIGTERDRGLRDLGTRRQGVQTEATRGREDFGTRINNLIHSYQVRGQQQTELASASGVMDSSTLQASAAARAGNMARDRQPLDTGLTRLNENEQTALGKLDTAQSDLLTDTGLSAARLQADSQQGAHRLRQDVHHDTRLAAQQLARQIRDIRTRRQRARREATIGTADITEQEIYQARSNHPGAFDTTGHRRRRDR